MKRTPLQAGAVLALLGGLAACQTSPVNATGSLAVPMSRLQSSARATVSGTVSVPLGYSADRRVAALIGLPLVGAEVSLADLAGERLADYAPVTTDEAGAFRFDGVPSDQNLLLIARIETPADEPAQLRALVHTSETGVVAELTIASTLLTSGLLQHDLSTASWPQEAFSGVAERIGEGLQSDRLPDLADPDAVLAEIKTIIQNDCNIQLAMRELFEGSSPEAACTPAPTPTPHLSFGGGGSSGGGSAPRPTATPTPDAGSVIADITISDGPRILATPSPTPTP